MVFRYLAQISGGRGDSTWETEIRVEGEDMTIRQALDKIEEMIAGDDAIVAAIEQE